KGQWFFTPETVQNIESMFRAVLNQAPGDGTEERLDSLAVPHFWETPGVWLRSRLPAWAQSSLGPLELYQWLGLGVAVAASWLAARVTMAGVTRLVAWLLHRCGSSVSSGFIITTLRPLTLVTAVWLFFLLLQALDLSVAIGSTVFAVEKFIVACLLG